VATEPADPQVTVVVPTRDRPQELRRCLGAILESAAGTSYAIIVVDDGSRVALTPADVTFDHPATITLLRREGIGPAGARNVGIDSSNGPTVLFTDDDTIPRSGWVDAAADFLASHPDHVGVAGATNSPPFDPLYFHSVDASGPGQFLTCNIAYRRGALREIGGFYEEFPYPHAEDLDLGARISKHGTVGFCDAMAVVHPPRPVSLLAQIRRGRLLTSDAMLFARHPDRYQAVNYVSGAGWAFMLNTKRWLYCMRHDVYGVGRNPWRALRFLALATGFTL
jgi:GT2 family glycosyltransferase